jgi:hypothetical protein
MDWRETVKFVEQHGGAVGPQANNPHIDHIWHLRKDLESLCGMSPGPDDGLDPAGQLCFNCRRALEKWARPKTFKVNIVEF